MTETKKKHRLGGYIVAGLVLYPVLSRGEGYDLAFEQLSLGVYIAGAIGSFYFFRWFTSKLTFLKNEMARSVLSGVIAWLVFAFATAFVSIIGYSLLQ